MTIQAPQAGLLANPGRIQSIVSGITGGLVGSVCWSLGVLAVASWSVGLNALFFGLDKVSPVGSRPVLVAVGFVITVVMTWLLTLRQRQGLPQNVSRQVLLKNVGVALFAGGATYFMMMEVIMPLAFVLGVPMGAFFPPNR